MNESYVNVDELGKCGIAARHEVIKGKGRVVVVQW